MSLIDKIKLLFEAEKTPQETKCADVKTKDGLILRVDGELKEGSIVSQLSEDGSVQIVGAADYELEDGSIISTDGTGAIIKIVAPEVPEEEMAEETPALETPVTDAPETDKITAIESKFIAASSSAHFVSIAVILSVSGASVAGVSNAGVSSAISSSGTSGATIFIIAPVPSVEIILPSSNSQSPAPTI